MPSLKREEEYKINQERYSSMKKSLKISFLMAIIPSAGVWVSLMLFIFIKTLAMLAGGNAFFAEVILNAANDTNNRSDLAVDIPYLLLTYLFIIALLTFVSFTFKKRKPLYVLYAVYGIGAICGLVGIISGECDLFEGMVHIAYGGYGIWLTDFIIRLYKEDDYLALQEGYPDFIVAIDEPRPMANTNGMYYKQSEYIKRQRKEQGENAEAAENKPDWEMDELTLDAQLPKGNRKIDNMM